MSRPTSPSPSRRTLVKGAAWAVPAVAVASAAPAFAQSPPPVIVTPPTAGGAGACKFPGGSCDGYTQAYRYLYCFENSTDQSITIALTDITVTQGGGGGGTISRTPQPASITVDANSEVCQYIILNPGDNSANGTACLSYTYTYEGGTGPVTVSDTSCTPQLSLNPCPDCSTDYPAPGPALQTDESVAETPDEAPEPAVKTEAETSESDVEQPTPAEQPAAPEAEPSTPDVQVPAPEVQETPDVRAPDTSQQTATPSNS